MVSSNNFLSNKKRFPRKKVAYSPEPCTYTLRNGGYNARKNFRASNGKWY